ncbi:MAG: vte5 [Candidatus Doudnabacteria bacterium]|nr:vte5 [Candidatus Doudnabacteria bacterium]
MLECYALAMIIILICLAFLVLLMATEWVQRWSGMKHEYSRKTTHVISGICVLIAPNFIDKNQILTLAALFAVLSVVSKYLAFFPSIQNVGRKTLGEIYFPIGVGIAAYLFLPKDLTAFQFGILVLTVSDTLAAVVGKAYGKHKLFNGKSIEGTAAFFLSTLIIFTFFIAINSIAIIPLWVGLLIALIMCLAELAFGAGLDNLILPALSAYLIKIFVA